MTIGSPTIPKDPQLLAGMDYFLLREKAIEVLGRLGSQQWTDYNTHDPGITLLESLLYAITDLGWRAGWDIKDLLADATGQPFPTAREALTSEPVTCDDYRRLLIDLDKVRNAWLTCKECSCGDGAPGVRGLYDIRLELESDDLVGDLNDRKITGALQVPAAAPVHEIGLEARFPRWDLADRAQFDALLALEAAPLVVDCIRLMRSTTAESPASTILGDAELRKHWRGVFYATLQVDAPSGVITLPDVALRLVCDVDGKNALGVADLLAWLEDGEASGVVPLYRAKQILVRDVLAQAKARYHAHRNLDEDLCRLGVVDVGEVAVCADIEVAPDADIELVQARVWLEIEKYLAPSIPFRSLAELRAAGVAVEDIFNGPKLDNGFILQADLDAAGLRGVVRASDLVNLLMDVEGVLSLGNLLLTRYDDAGNPVKGAADPSFASGKPVFDPGRTSAAWLLYMADGQQPRLYHELSNFKFRKNGLPFDADEDEAWSTLIQLRGEAERPRQPASANDLPVPRGRSRKIADILPVQYQLPFCYGVGPEGLPTSAGAARRGQARQLKAYLLVFEQILGNAFEQLAHLGDLFSRDLDVASTRFAHVFGDADIQGLSDVVTSLGAADLQELCESETQFLDRRNAFLDHVMARFGLDFSEHALLLSDWKSDAVARRDLIEDKLGVLAAWPELSGARFRAFDHRREPTLPGNAAVLKRRITLLLGFPDLRLQWTWDESVPADVKVTAWSLLDVHERVWMQGSSVFHGASKAEAARAAADLLLERMSLDAAWTLHPASGGFRLVVRDAVGQELGDAAQVFATEEEAEDFAEELIAAAGMARSLVVEHLLLRPKFPGDAVYEECGSCEDDDPWSFRLTVVMPGWSRPYDTNLDLRDFANRTIQEEVPAHLLAKICWVGNDGYEADECAPIVVHLAKILEQGALTTGGARPDCVQARSCAAVVHELHVAAFTAWHQGKEQQSYGKQALPKILGGVFAGLSASDVSCGLDLAGSWSALQAALVAHFTDVVTRRLQFSRFEQAWYAWLQADAAFDWGEEQLTERLEALLRERLQAQTDTDLCTCAASLLQAQGQAFLAWMTENLEQGRELSEFTDFAPPPVTLCPGATFAPGTVDLVAGFLAQRYAAYTEVSYRLTLLVRLLETLANTWPAATLHDCDEGSDTNPVRLNQTALGTLAQGGSPELDLTVQPEPEQ